MPFDISRYARGLPSLLDLKQRGEGLHFLADQLVATLDVRALYLLQNRETIICGTNAAPTVGALSYSTPFTVPQNELWYVWEYFVTATVGAGEAITLQPGMTFDGIASAPMGPSAAGAANTSLWVPSAKEFWATPGSEFKLMVSALTLTPPLSGAVVVSKLRL